MLFFKREVVDPLHEGLLNLAAGEFRLPPRRFLQMISAWRNWISRSEMIRSSMPFSSAKMLPKGVARGFIAFPMPWDSLYRFSCH